MFWLSLCNNLCLTYCDMFSFFERVFRVKKSNNALNKRTTHLVKENLETGANWEHVKTLWDVVTDPGQAGWRQARMARRGHHWQLVEAELWTAAISLHTAAYNKTEGTQAIVPCTTTRKRLHILNLHSLITILLSSCQIRYIWPKKYTQLSVGH